MEDVDVVSRDLPRIASSPDRGPRARSWLAALFMLWERQDPVAGVDDMPIPLEELFAVVDHLVNVFQKARAYLALVPRQDRGDVRTGQLADFAGETVHADAAADHHVVARP